MLIKSPSSSQAPFQRSRFKWSLQCGLVAERDIYPKVLEPKQIQRPQGNKDWLDKHYGVDALITSWRGRNFAVAERFRGKSYHSYQELTLRFQSLWTDSKVLEVDKSIARVMLYGYADTNKPTPPNEIIQWIIVDLQLLLDKYHSRQLKPVSEEENNDCSSTFLAFGFQQLREAGVVIRESNDF